MFPGVTRGRPLPSISLRELLRKEYLAELSRTADKLLYRVHLMHPERHQGTVREKQKLLQRKMRLSERANRIIGKVVSKRVSDRALLSYFQKRKFFCLPNKALMRFRKDISLDEEFTFSPKSAIEAYWNDVVQRIMENSAQEPDSEADSYERNFVPRFTINRLASNMVELVVPEDSGENHERLARVDYVTGSTADLSWKRFSPAKRLPAHLGFACRMPFSKADLRFLRVRATDTRGKDLLSPAFCVDSTGSNVIFQHQGLSLEEIIPLYLEYFRQERNASKTASKGVEPDTSKPARAERKKSIAKELDVT